MFDLKTVFAAAVAVAGLTGSAGASTFTDCATFGAPDISSRVSTAIGCEVMQPDTQDYLNTTPLTVNKDGGFFDIGSWVYETKYDGNPAPGNYDLTSLFTGQTGDVLMVFKSGQNPLVGYLLSTASLVGTWSNPFTDPPFALPGQSTEQTVSHLTIYSNIAPIPLPAAGVLLIGALGGLGIAARRRKG